MYGWRRSKSRHDIARPAVSEPIAELAPVPAPSDSSQTRVAARRDLLVGIGSANATNLSLRKTLREAFALVDEIAAFSGAFEETATAMQTGVDGFVSSVGSLQRQGHLIEDRLVDADDALDKAHRFSRNASAGVTDLTAAIGEVERAVKTISAIAAHTSLLALNATIEGARAGEAGAGFRVVASEVKLLANQTHRATNEISASVKRIRERSQINDDAVQDVEKSIKTIEGVFGQVRASVVEQATQTHRIEDGSKELAALAQDVRTSARRMRDLGGTARAMTERAESAAAATRATFATLAERAAIVMRHGDEESGEGRWPAMLAATLTVDGRVHRVRVIDLALDALQIETGAELPMSLRGETVALDIEDLGHVDIQLLMPTASGYAAMLVDPSAFVIDRIERKLAELKVLYRPYIQSVQRLAAEAAALIEQRIDAQLLTIDELFDTNYRRDGDAEPAKYLNAAVAPLEAFMRPLLEGALLASPKPEFCILQDRNGFNPIHNLHCSRPARTGDVVWNLRNSRSRRIFDDRVGMSASRNLKSFFVQSYARDMGDSIEMRMEFDAPIFIRDRHWGALRMAYELAERAPHDPPKAGERLLAET